MTETTNRVALVTGASRGLGAVIVQFLAGEGYDLVITARGSEALNEFAASLKPFDVHVKALAGDVNNAAHRQALVGAAQELGGLDVLVNNASDLGPSPPPAVADYPLNALANLFSTNVVAQVGLAQAALPLLQARDGLIVNISSDAAKGGYPGWAGYGATKAALDLISLTMA